eukprot:SAG22_NODE_4252_length_1327_cov_1.052117_2_plen_55_part_00
MLFVGLASLPGLLRVGLLRGLNAVPWCEYIGTCAAQGACLQLVCDLAAALYSVC